MILPIQAQRGALIFHYSNPHGPAGGPRSLLDVRNKLAIFFRQLVLAWLALGLGVNRRHVVTKHEIVRSARDDQQNANDSKPTTCGHIDTDTEASIL